MVNETLLDDSAALAAAAALNGRWLATAAQLGGVRLPDHVLPDLTLHLHSGTFVFGEDTGLIAIDRTRHPAALDPGCDWWAELRPGRSRRVRASPRDVADLL
jgi:hypothetical protein